MLLARSTWEDFHLYTMFFNYFHIGLNSFVYFISDKSPGVLLGSGMSKTTTSADLSVKHFLWALSHTKDQCQPASSSVADLIDFICGHGESSHVASTSPARIRQKSPPQVKMLSSAPICLASLLELKYHKQKKEMLVLVYTSAAVMHAQLVGAGAHITHQFAAANSCK